jgi:hypothetical protein
VRQRKRGAQCRLSDEGSEQRQAAKACADPGVTLLLNAGEQLLRRECSPIEGAPIPFFPGALGDQQY